MHVAEKFERLLETYRHPDGRKWSGAELAKATGGIVHRSYFTNLRKGRIESPGYEKMRAMAMAMDFPPALWFEEKLGDGAKVEPVSEGLADRVEHLFQGVTNPKTGGPYTDVEVARMSAGDLSEEDIEGIRSGRIADPSVGQMMALGSAFGVESSYLLDRGQDLRVLDGGPDGAARRGGAYNNQRGLAPARPREEDNPGHRAAVWSRRPRCRRPGSPKALRA